MKPARIAIFVAIVQAILLLGHWFVYTTWVALWPAADPSGISSLQVTFALLSVSFVAASLLAWRYTHVLVRLFYTIAAVWLGVGNFLLVAACVCWMILGAAGLFRLHVNRQTLAVTLFSLAVVASLYGIVNVMIFLLLPCNYHFSIAFTTHLPPRPHLAASPACVSHLRHSGKPPTTT
jgi:hypothetical protein